MDHKQTWTLFVTGAAALMLGTTAAAAPSPGTLLVLEKGTLTLALIDPHSLKVVARVPSGPDPHEVIASSDGRCAYISNYGGDGGDLHTISVVDLQARAPLQPIDLGALRSPHGLDFADGRLYFTAETSKAIGRYDPATQRIDWVMGTGQDRTHMVQVAQDPAHLVTSNVTSGSISFLDETIRQAAPPPPGAPGNPPVAANAPARNPPVVPPPRRSWTLTTVAAGRGAEGFDISPDGRQVWAANAQDGTVTVIDVATKKAVQTFPIPVAGANRLKFTPNGKVVLLSGLGRFGAAATTSEPTANLIAVDVVTHAITRRFDLGGGSAGILMDPDGTRAYVAVTQGNRIAVVDLATLQVTGEIAPLAQPDGIAWAGGP